MNPGTQPDNKTNETNEMKANPTHPADTPAPIETLNSLVTCHYTVTAPATSVLNRSATARVIHDAAAAKNASRVFTSVLTSRGTAIGKAISIQNMTGTSLRRLGLPIRTGGFYLPVKKIIDAQNTFDDAQVQLEQCKQDILAEYPAMEQSIRLQLGRFADEVNIPSASEVVSKFTMSLYILNQPVPVGELAGVAAEVANRVRAESQRQTSDLLRAAHCGPLSDLKAQLAEFADRMRNAERLRAEQFTKLRD